MRTNTIVLDTLRHRLLKGYDKCYCHVCKESLQIGDLVVSEARKWFHIDCYNNIRLDIPDSILLQDDGIDFYIENGKTIRVSSLLEEG